jgi:hypothetical protein
MFQYLFFIRTAIVWPNSEYGYNIEKDAVIEVEIVLEKPHEMSRFGFDLSRFQKVEVEDVVGLFTYTNDEDGQEFYGTLTMLSNIILSPSKEQDRLACENVNSSN